MNYVDGFVSQIYPGRLDDYKKMAEMVASVFIGYGALAYVESLGTDVPYGKVTSFPRAVGAPEGAQIVFSFALYRDKAHRDEVQKKVFADPRMRALPENAPIDMKNMIYGGFVPLVNAGILSEQA